MAAQVLSGANNASYTNNTGQNVRLIINYMSNVTSMTWAGVTVTASAKTIGKNIPITTTTSSTGTGTISTPTGRALGSVAVGSDGRLDAAITIPNSSINITTTTAVSDSSNNFPIELMLANGQSFSSVCGAFNAIVIKEDGT